MSFEEMTRTKKAMIGSGLAILIGLVLYICATYGQTPYPGYGGGGMSGLPAAFVIALALLLMGLGSFILLISLLIHWWRN